MSLIQSSIKRPIFMTMILLSIVLFGGIYFFRMGIDLFPKVDLPIITVVSVLPGADPQTTESMVTEPIEEAVSSISSIKNLRSRSSAGISRVIIEFELEKDINDAYQEVQAKVGAIRSRLPSDLIAPTVQKIDFDALPVLSVLLSGPQNIDVLTDIAKKQVKEPLQQLANVGEIRLIGGREKKIWLYLDRDKVQSHQITIAEIEQSLKTHHIEIPGGRLQDAETETPVKINAEFGSISELADWIVAYRKGSAIRICDLGSVEEGLEEERSFSRLNDQSAIALLVQRQSGSNTVEVANAIKKECERFKAVLQKQGVQLQIAQDNSVYIQHSVADVYFHLLFGGGLAVLIVFLFLRNFRSTLVCSLSLPVAIIGTFSFMYLMGFTQNMMTLLALSIAIGLLIDDAIVVQENIMRHIEMGYPPDKASLIGARQIALAVLATTLSIVAVFVPVAFVKGMIGRFFYQFGMTITVAVLISLFVSFTLNPMFSAYFLKPAKPSGRFYECLETGLRMIENGYARLIRWSLNHRALVIAIAIGSLLSALYGARWLRLEFRPQEDQSEFLVSLELPRGASIGRMKDLAIQAHSLLKNHSWLDYTFQTIGSDSMQSVHKGTIYVKMADKKLRRTTQQEAMNEARSVLSSLPAKVAIEPFDKMASGTGSTELMIEINGPDLDKLNHISQLLQNEMAVSKGYLDVSSSMEESNPQIDIAIHRDLAADLGVNPLAIASTIRTAIGGTDAAKFRQGSDRYDIAIRMDEKYRQTIDQIELLSVKNNTGKMIPLKNLIAVRDANGLAEIGRGNHSRQIVLTANLDHRQKVIGQAMSELQSVIDGLDVPPSYSIEFAGQSKVFKESFINLGFALLLAVLIIYMTLAAQFESFSYPFLIMLALPLSLIGAVGALVIFGQTMSIFSMIGIIMLMGLVTKNGVLLVDRINSIYHEDGICQSDAVCQGGQQRLRPILMTTLAIIFGMLPIAFGTGSGSESQAPMAITVIGGLFTSTILTLVVIPVAYTLWDDALKYLTRVR
jgi:HAE1 family hydrophobic/amphiphilic exporter-1